MQRRELSLQRGNCFNCWMEPLAVWVNNEGKQTKENDERRQRCVKQILIAQNIARLGIQQHENDGRWRYTEQFQIG